MIETVAINGLFVGKVRLLGGESRSSAIAKAAAESPLWLGEEGLAGDEQADRRVHGGAEKAFHHLPAEHYARLAAAFAQMRPLAPGDLGENLSTFGLTEETVCIGDVFALGGAQIEVAQPRKPCWKIDHQAGCEGVASHIAEQGMAGWYYRVRRAGTVSPGDTLSHLERPPGAVTLAYFWRTVNALRPSLAALDKLARTPGLTPAWVHKLRERIDWLHKNA